MEQNPAVAVDAGAPEVTGPQWVVFRCHDRRFAAPLDHVREILTPLPYTRIPGCGPEVCGLAGVRGRVITAFDLGVALGTQASAARADHRLLLVESGDRLAGVVVDEVEAITHATAEHGAAPEDLDLDAGEVLGICRIGGERYVALKLDKIVGRLMG
jgi:chemotaxis signal transduction protein